MSPDLQAVRHYLLTLQDKICTALEQEDGSQEFIEDTWNRPQGGGGRTRILTEGDTFEKAGVSFSHVTGTSLPSSATATRPELAGKPFHALGVSLVIHPRNPYVPTTHMNVRFFQAGEIPRPMVKQPKLSLDRTPPPPPPVWWFGGGFDLTPSYGFAEDATHWHRAARTACTPFGSEMYPKLKQACDEYFFLKHRDEARGIGGIFFDDFNAPGFKTSFELMRSVGDAFLPAYLPIVKKRKATPYGPCERDFQLYRRGRYVEFNLIWDRGTQFGLQSGGRTESILMSLPPLVAWHYNWKNLTGSPEDRLQEDFLKPRDWAKG